MTVERAIADGAYGTGDNRAACVARDTDLVSPLAVPPNPEVAKTAFTIDLSGPHRHLSAGPDDDHSTPHARRSRPAGPDLLL